MRARSLLVVTQVALALVLLMGAGLALQTFQRLRNLPLGFNPRDVLTLLISLPDAKYEKEAIAHFYDALQGRVAALPGVVAVASAVNVPFDDNEWDSSVHITGTPDYKLGEEPSAEFSFVSPDYFKVLRIPLLKGAASSRATCRDAKKWRSWMNRSSESSSPTKIRLASTSTTRRRWKRIPRR